MIDHDERDADVALTPKRESPASDAYCRYVLMILFLAQVLNFVDRQVISILLEDIKEDLGVSDTAMGFLTGIAFALFYVVAGIPIARWADVGVRRSIIAMGIAVWSLMTACCGLAQTFAQLAVARIGVGVGEAACSPPSHSLLSDYFPPEKRATALALMGSGVNAGILFGLLGGGWLNEYFGWRRAFFIVGAPGLLLALVMRLTVREPQRGGADGLLAVEKPDSTIDVFRYLWKLRSFRHIAAAASLSIFASLGFGTWTPTFLRRVHDLGSAEAGTYLGLISGIVGAAGAISVGLLADRLGRRDIRWYLWISAIASAATVPFALCFLFIESLPLALICFVPSVFFSGPWAAVYAATQGLVRPRMRAMSSAILFFVMNLIGMGLGPQVVGILNDLLAGTFGDDAIRYSLAIAKVMTIWAAVHFLLAARTFRADWELKNQ